jgi:hypothetical protein
MQSQSFDVRYQRFQCVVAHLPRGLATAASSLIEQYHVLVQRWIEETDVIGIASGTRSAVQEEGGESIPDRRIEVVG